MERDKLEQMSLDINMKSLMEEPHRFHNKYWDSILKEK